MRKSLTLFLATALVASGCGDDKLVGPPPQPSPTVTLITVTGSSSMKQGTTAQFTVNCAWSDNATRTCPSGLIWASSAPNVASVTNGTVTAVSPGLAQISASVGGVTGDLGLEVQAILTEAAIVGDTTLEAPTPKQYRLVGKYSDGSEKDLTDSAMWSYPNPDYVVGEVSATGVLTPHSLGTIRVQATYQGVTYTMSVRVVGTPWSQLPPLTAGGKVLVQGTIASNGMIWSFAKGLTTVWHDPVIPHQNMVDAMELIKSADSTGTFAYAFVTDSASARWRFDFVGPNTPPVPAGHCGWAGSGTVVNNTLTEGRGSILRDPVVCMDKAVLAHMGFHMLGIMVHTPPDTDILSSSGIIFRVSEDLKSAVSFLQIVESGTIPIDP